MNDDSIQKIFNKIMELEAEAEKNLMLQPHNPFSRAEGYAEGRRDAFRICAKIIKSFFVVDYKEDCCPTCNEQIAKWMEPK